MIIDPNDERQIDAVARAVWADTVTSWANLVEGATLNPSGWEYRLVVMARPYAQRILRALAALEAAMPPHTPLDGQTDA